MRCEEGLTRPCHLDGWKGGPTPTCSLSSVLLSTEYILGAGVEWKSISRKTGRHLQQGEYKVASLQDGPVRENWGHAGDTE